MNGITPIYWDLGLALVFTLGLQTAILVTDRRKRPVSERDEALQLSYYNQTGLLLAVALALVIGTWLVLERPLGALGLTPGRSWPAIAGWAFAAAAALFLLGNVIGVARNAKWREKARRDIESTEGIDDMLPRSAREHRRFLWLSLLGGVAEEVVYRGFLIWVFAAYMNPWLAALVSLVFFTVAHTYYGSWLGRAKVALAGALLTALYLLSGTLWPAILLHVATNMAGGSIAWLVRRFNASASP